MEFSLFLLNLFLFLLGLILLLIISLAVYLYITAGKPDFSSHSSENKFIHYTPNGERIHRDFPSLHDPPSLSLSVVIPAYNEEERLSIMVDEALTHLKSKSKKSSDFTYEIILVDDGSVDKTTQVALKYTQSEGSDRFRVLTQVKNRGKGGAVKMGVLRCRGKRILFADADGATKFGDVDKLDVEMNKLLVGEIMTKQERGVVCGSRAHLEKDSIAQRSIFRTFLMYCFHFLVWSLCVRGVKDTQCGFKMFSRQAALLLFSNLHVHRWAFDVDLLHIAQNFKVPVSEVAVTWTEIPGSKLSPLWASLQMFKDLIFIRLRYLTGSWRMTEVNEAKDK